MFRVTVPTTDDFYCLCDLTGIDQGKSVIVTNNTNSILRINRSLDKPTDPLLSFPVWPAQTIVVHGNDIQPIWARGSAQGHILVQMLTETVMPLTCVEFPQDIVTSGVEKFRRLQVDQGQTGFFEGRNFRFMRKIRGDVIFKFTSTVDFVLYEQEFNVSSGNYEFHAWNADNVTETSSFNTDLSNRILNQNSSSEYRDYDGDRYQTQVTIGTGGSINVIDEDAYNDYADMVTSGFTAFRTGVTELANTQRYLSAGTYYLQFTDLSTGSTGVRGIYQIGWEERPEGVK